MRTLLRRLALWALDLTPEQLSRIRERSAAGLKATLWTGEQIRARAITGDKIAAGSISAGCLAPGSIGLEHLAPEVRGRLLSSPPPSIPQMMQPPLGSGRLAPRPPISSANTGEFVLQKSDPRLKTPDLAARDGGSGGQ